MKEKTIFRRAAAGLALTAAVVAATALIVLSAADTAEPSINFKCLEFKLVDDGTIQAVVTISAENIPYLASTEFSINYNDKYIKPSDAESNAVLNMGETQAFFMQDKTLYPVLDSDGKQASPFLAHPPGTGKTLNLGELGTVGAEKYLFMALYLNKDGIAPEGGGKIKWLPYERDGKIGALSLPSIIADGTVDDGKGAVIGTISFRVDPDNLTEMVQKFSSGGTITNPSADEKPYLLGLSEKLSGSDVWVVNELYYDESSGDILAPRGYTKTDPKDMKVNFLFTFPRVLVKAAPAVPEVTVNAYEAYTDGTAGDLAAALRKYSPTIRAGYADGSFEDFLLPWGSSDAGAEYHVYKLNSNGTKGDEVAAYDPRGGAYLVEQYFFYEEADDSGTSVTKKFPLPMEVKLTVEPVKAQSVAGADLSRTYLNTADSTNPVPAFFSKLGLPNVATLVVSPVPGATSLTLPLDAAKWSNYSADLSETVTKDTTPVGWPVDSETPGQIQLGAGAGEYPFIYTLTRAEIQGAYPWLSDVRESYTLSAVRVIKKDPAGFTDPAGYSASVARVGEKNENAKFTVTHPSGTNIQSLALFLPNGQKVTANITVNATAGTVTTTADDSSDHELRRYLNLGGWFALEVEETADGGAAAELPVYLAPRDNLYLEDRTGEAPADNLGRFDFSGYYAGLFPYASAHQLDGAVVLPAGYFVRTTYNGMNGAPGGELSTVRADWRLPNTSTEAGLLPGRPDRTLYTYGPIDYAGAWFDGYGQVKNSDNKKVEIRVEDQAPNTDPLRLSLTCAPGTAGASVSGGEVTGVVYNTRQKGYRTRQEFTLTLKNTSTRDIYGLSLQLPADNHFEIIKAPAAYLAAGTETTFTVTYLYDLEPANLSDTGLTLKDTIGITTNETGNTPIKSFTAQFRVTNGPVSSVRVVTNSPLTATDPVKPIMGSAKLILGLEEKKPADGAGTGTDKPDTADGPTDYEANYQYVWVRSEVYDEYEVSEVYYYKNNVQSSANKVALTPYAYAGTDGEGDKVAYYYFQMPDDDVTVYVDFMESVYSKLRLSAIKPEADKGDGSGMSPRDLRRWDNNAVAANNGDPLTMEESGLKQFLVVLNKDDATARLTLKLREVLAVITAGQGSVVNENIPVNVLVMMGSDTLLNALGNTKGPDGTPDSFTTSAFKTPEPGNSVDLVITVSHTPDSGNAVTRSVTVTVARPPETAEYSLKYGNSPYGMIMNSSNLTEAGKTAAKAEFDKIRAFASGLTPAKAEGLANVYYADAWGGGTDYDLDETALFAYSGEPFLDPGADAVRNTANRPVAAGDISRAVKVTLLDDGAATQTGRFSGAATATLDLGTANVSLVENWWKAADGSAYLIRPGVYEIVYSYTDYDGSTLRFTRPFIILSRNGDVNADMTVGETDAKLIEDRVTDPLGCTAPAAAYPDRQLFRWRVCDVNNDSNLNNIDANLTRDAGKIIPYYLPKDYQ